MNESDSRQATNIPLGKAAKSLPEQLADLLLAEVVAGRLRAGDRLKEETLAQKHAVSRATVREALIALAKQGFVVRIPRFGARIAEFSRQDLDDLFELRAALLAVAAGRCARHGGREQLATLEALVMRLEALAADPATDPQVFASQSVYAQTFLIEWCGNRHLPIIYDRLASMGTWQLIRGQATSFLTADWRRESAADWRRLADHLSKKNVASSEQAARRLLEHSAARVRLHLDEVTSDLRALL
jgi:DNA-binding GntR family transcriptional regulator